MSFIIKALQLLLIIFAVLKYILPQHKATFVLNKVFEPILKPIRKLVSKQFPSVKNFQFDYGIVVLFIILIVLDWIF